MNGFSAVGAVSTTLCFGTIRITDSSNAAIASLITQVASLRKKLEKTQSGMCTFSKPVAGWRSRLLDSLCVVIRLAGVARSSPFS